MKARRRQSGLVPMISLLGALILAVVPMPGAVAAFRPDWVAVALLYWTLIQPRRHGLAKAFVLGVLLDALTGSLLGQHALALLVIVYLGQRLYLRVRAFPASQVATMVVLLLALYELVLLVIDGFAGREVPLIERWAPVLTGGLVWLLASAGVERGRQAAEAQI
jgi:rod shape-determining protein MreD